MFWIILPSTSSSFYSRQRGWADSRDTSTSTMAPEDFWLLTFSLLLALFSLHLLIPVTVWTSSCDHSSYIALFHFLICCLGACSWMGKARVRESSQRRLQAQQNHPRPEVLPNSFDAASLEADKQLCHFGLLLLSLQRFIFLNVWFACMIVNLLFPSEAS